MREPHNVLVPSAPSTPSSTPPDSSSAEERARPQGQAWLKVDFHTHTAEDPLDELDYSALDLLHRAHALGFHALAITLHSEVLLRPEITEAACQLGLLLIPAAEMRIEGADVVILNISPEEAACLHTWHDLACLRERRDGSVFIFAPHPFYLMGGSIGGKRLREHLDLFDAIEFCHLHTPLFDRNAPAVALAEALGKPLLATSDTHRLTHFGEHHTLVEAPMRSGVADLFAAIRAGRTRLVSPAYSLVAFLKYLCWIFLHHELRLLQAKLSGQR